jgi:hypothetical protein
LLALEQRRCHACRADLKSARAFTLRGSAVLIVSNDPCARHAREFPDRSESVGTDRDAATI